MGIFWFLRSSNAQRCQWLGQTGEQRRTKAEGRTKRGERGKSVVEGSRVETSKTGASNEPANQPASYPDGRLLTVTP